MGLDTSHNAWHGSYGSFYNWRRQIARAAGCPPLDLMEGFYFESSHNMFTLLDHKFPLGTELEVGAINNMRKDLPIKWDSLKPSTLHELLNHSDCDGYISYGKCGKIAKELERIFNNLPVETEEESKFPYSLRNLTKQFIDGLKLANEKKEKLIFS